LEGGNLKKLIYFSIKILVNIINFWVSFCEVLCCTESLGLSKKMEYRNPQKSRSGINNRMTARCRLFWPFGAKKKYVKNTGNTGIVSDLITARGEEPADE
jgi:hypothetical protein